MMMPSVSIMKVQAVPRHFRAGRRPPVGNDICIGSIPRCNITRAFIARSGALCSIARARRPPGYAGASMDSIVQPAATEQPSSSRNRLLLTVYTAAIFVSALLLFSVQPLFTKMVLPRLGGSPAVWSVAMVFFQSLLLAGYAYAHLLMQVKNRIIP